MSEVKYSKEHEWIKLDGDIATIGNVKFEILEISR